MRALRPFVTGETEAACAGKAAYCVRRGFNCYGWQLCHAGSWHHYWAIAHALRKFSALTIITNSIKIAADMGSTNFDVILTGGTLRKSSFSMVGPIAEDVLKEMHADILFLGADGFDAEIGLTTPNILEARSPQLERSSMSMIPRNFRTAAFPASRLFSLFTRSLPTTIFQNQLPKIFAAKISKSRWSSAFRGRFFWCSRLP